MVIIEETINPTSYWINRPLRLSTEEYAWLIDSYWEWMFMAYGMCMSCEGGCWKIKSHIENLNKKI